MRDTIDMAREAGGRAQQNKNCDVEYLMSADALKTLVALVRADEREALEKLFESRECWLTTEMVVAAIRARGNT